ncbi:MAG: phage tail tape measure protein, partial [Ancylobacter novellus]
MAGILGFSSALDSLKTAIDGADRLDELNARFGITTEQLSSWGYAAKMTGSDLEGLASIIPKFSKNIADAADSNSTAGKTFAALGINIRDQSGQLRSFQDLLPEVADKFKLLENETTETALAMQLFGKSGSEFLEFLNLGSDGLKSMEDRAKALGIVIDSNTASAAANFNDRMDDLKAATNGWFTQLAAQLLPTLNEFATKLVELAKNGDAVRAVADGVSSAFSGIGQAVDALQPVFNFFDRLRGVLVGIELQGNAAAQSLNPANWNIKDLSRLGAQYRQGSAYAGNGYKAMQTPTVDRTVQIIDPSDGFAEWKKQQAEMAEAEARAKALQERLDALLNGSGSSKPSKRAKALKEVKDAATQAVEDYDAIYGGAQDRADSQVGALEKEIALWGDRTEAAKVSYEIQRGALQGISEQQAEYLLSLAKTRDALEDYDDIYGKMDEKAKESASQMS